MTDTPFTPEIAGRLEALVIGWSRKYDSTHLNDVASDVSAALARIKALEAALEPFAATTIRDDIPADQAVIGYADIVYLTVADFRRAASALAAPAPMGPRP